MNDREQAAELVAAECGVPIQLARLCVGLLGSARAAIDYLVSSDGLPPTEMRRISVEHIRQAQRRGELGRG